MSSEYVVQQAELESIFVVGFELYVDGLTQSFFI